MDTNPNSPQDRYDRGNEELLRLADMEAVLQTGLVINSRLHWSSRRNDFQPSATECAILLEMCAHAEKVTATHTQDITLCGRTCGVTVHPLQDSAHQATTLLVITNRDHIAALKQHLEDSVCRSKELDAIVHATSDGIWVCNAEGVVIFINPAGARINNIMAEDVIGRNMRDLINEGFIDRSAALEVIRTGEAVSLLQNRDGRRLTSTGTPVFDTDGVLQRVVVSTQDVTEVDNLRMELERKELLADNYRSQLMDLHENYTAGREIIARSPKMLSALRQALKAGNSDASILLLGESGTGKGLLAELIHNNSRRNKKLLLSLNCGAIPDSLVESELFGYEKGAFTGAKSCKPGLLEVADNGTLFLDEVSELALQTQVKLLKFLDNGKFTRLGGTKEEQVDVRVIAATNRDLKAMAQRGKFREDLYYRLNIIPLQIPALRERRECIPALLHHFITYYGQKYGTPKRLRSAAMNALSVYEYPGNVRQLINICERLVVMTDHDLIDTDDLMKEVGAGQEYVSFQSLKDRQRTLKQAIQDYEKSILLDAYKRCATQHQIADILDISQASVARKLKQYGILSRRDQN